jgi:2-oxoglutarate ferredoxin oxidoreductase subunit beta
LLDVISPCVTFNDHAGSTKSYLHTRQHQLKVLPVDLVPPADEIMATIRPEGVTSVTMHDGSRVAFRAAPEGYDPTDRQSVFTYLQEQQGKGEIVTGLLYLDESVADLHEMNNTSPAPLARLPYEALCPGAAALTALQDALR